MQLERLKDLAPLLRSVQGAEVLLCPSRTRCTGGSSVRRKTGLELRAQCYRSEAVCSNSYCVALRCPPLGRSMEGSCALHKSLLSATDDDRASCYAPRPTAQSRARLQRGKLVPERDRSWTSRSILCRRLAASEILKVRESHEGEVASRLAGRLGLEGIDTENYRWSGCGSKDLPIWKRLPRGESHLAHHRASLMAMWRSRCVHRSPVV